MQQRHPVREEVERPGRGTGDREPDGEGDRTGVAPKYSTPAAFAGNAAVEDLEGREGQLRLVPVERPVERGGEPEGADAGAEGEEGGDRHHGSQGDAQGRAPVD